MCLWVEPRWIISYDSSLWQACWWRLAMLGLGAWPFPIPGVRGCPESPTGSNFGVA